MILVGNFGKTNHRYLSKEQVQFVIKQGGESDRVRRRAIVSRSMAKLRSVRESRIENMLTGKPRQLVRDLIALEKRGNMNEMRTCLRLLHGTDWAWRAAKGKIILYMGSRCGN